MTGEFARMRQEVEEEAHSNILPFWMERVCDLTGETFAGEVRFDGEVVMDAPKSGILAARLVWTFSHAALLYHEAVYRSYADMLYRYFIEHFWDDQYGGIFWSVDGDGNPLDVKKHIYANSFAMYALVEYHRATGNKEALERGKAIFGLVERYAHDEKHLGWFESFDQDWRRNTDARLALDEDNAPKSMNTHLHLMEAMANLLRVWRDPILEMRMREMLRIFLDHIIHPDNHQFILFLGEDWTPRSEVISFGHDIEGSWLLVEAADILGDAGLMQETRERGLKMVEVTLQQGMDEDGALIYEAASHEPYAANKDWWPQAETVVGLLNAYESTLDLRYLQGSVKTWDWIKKNLVNPVHGEWYWGTTREGQPIQRELAGFWKCPYHNSRMCFEVQERFERLHS